jgi:diguanylate cyclase (GGDEF)-like protein
MALIMTRNIAGPISQLKLSTQEISEGNFDHLPQVQSRDELGDLAKSFQEMAIRLKQLEEMYLDANPLTRLPGGVAIEQVLKTKLAEKAPLAFCLADLRNFKAFNDRYGYARGNEVILATTEMIRQAVKDHGKEGDFIGHIGGDDFVLVTSPAEYEKICSAIVETFDRQILKFYDPEDQQRGHIQGKTRRGEPVSFPIMTIAIAVVTNQQRELKSHIQIGEIAAEMKNFAKKFSKSIFVVDKRRDRPPEGA